ncbi:MAG: tyrosine-type recombinase/integrase [Pseudomonadota bacterium]
MPLSDAAVRSVKPKEKPQKLADGGGLFLLVTPTGSKWWRLKYRYDGKEKLLSLGVYPDTGLKEAREKRDAARKLLAAGIDPGENRKAVKAARALEETNSFEVIAREWFAKQEAVWADTHSSKVIRRLEMDVFPWIGKRSMDSLTAPDLLAVLRKVEERGAVDTAHRILQNFGQVFRYAVATGRATNNPAPNLRGALKAIKQSHFAAITEPSDIGGLLRAIDGYDGAYVTKSALRLAPLVFVRPGELRGAEWAEFDLDKAEWNIPAARMKLRIPHLVPLSRQALEILRDLHKVTGKERFVFPSAREKDRPMSNNAILAAIRRMGYEQGQMTGHGFRAMARTILDEVLQVRPDFIEHQLAHAVRDPNGRAYNRTAHKAERQKMMQIWADYLDEVKQK